ncbi:MAG: hypothetical protein QXX41_13775 [Nitrososphaerota archaeon]
MLRVWLYCNYLHFYRSRSRLKNMYAAYRLWLDAQYKNNRFRKYAMLSYERFIDYVINHKREGFLKDSTALLQFPKQYRWKWVTNG